MSGQEVVVREEKGITVLVLPEILDYPTVYKIRETITQYLESGKSRLLLDLGGVKELNSTGLGIIISRLRKAREAGGDIKLMNPVDEIRSLMEVMGADKIFDIVESVEQGLVVFESRIE